MTILYLLILMQHPIILSPQNYSDSLLHVIQKSGISDSSKIDTYNELSFYLAGRDPKVGLSYADSARKLAEKANLPDRIANAENSFGVNYWYLGEDSLAALAYHHVLDYYLKVNNEKGLARINNNLALIAYNKGDYRNALTYHETANRIFERLKMRNNLINSLSNTGVVFLAIADYPVALSYFMKALAMTEPTEILEKANLNTNIGLIHKNLNNLTLAKQFHQEAIDQYKSIDHKQGEASALSNLANVFQMQKDLLHAKHLYEKALSLNIEIGNQRKLASDFTNLAMLHVESQELAVAGAYLEKAEAIYTDTHDALDLSLVLLEKSKLIQKISGKSSTAYQEVLSLQKESLRLARAIGSLNRQMEAYFALSETLEAMGRFSEALMNFRFYTQVKDSIFNNENTKKITKLQIEYDYHLREQELQATFQIERNKLQAEKDQEKLLGGIYLGAFILLVAGSATVFFLNSKRNLAENGRREALFSAQKSELELKALRAQMNPHFIFNALSSISNFLLNNQPESADFYLGKFAKLIRAILEFSDQKRITLDQEINVIKQYIAIESMRLGKDVELVIRKSENLNLLEFQIPPLMLQPFIENAIWHGISKIDGKGIIEVEITKDVEGLKIKIRDNGVGRSGESKLDQERKSMGIQITQDRLNLLQSKDHQKSNAISWKNLEQGFEVGIQIPV